MSALRFSEDDRTRARRIVDLADGATFEVGDLMVYDRLWREVRDELLERPPPEGVSAADVTNRLHRMLRGLVLVQGGKP